MSNVNLSVDIVMLWVLLVAMCLRDPLYIVMEEITLWFLKKRLRRRTPQIESYTPLETPRTREAAERIFLESLDDDLTRAIKQGRKVRGIAYSLTGIVLFIVAFTFFPLSLFPFALAMTGVAFGVGHLLDYRQYDKTREKWVNSLHDRQKNDEEVIEAACEYAQRYNYFESSMGRAPVPAQPEHS